MPNTDLPNQWEVIVDYSKTVISLSVALLGVSVTFSDSLLSNVTTDLQKYLVYGAWVFLLLTLMSAILSIAFCINFLRHSKKDTLSILCSNLAFFFLIISGLLFVSVGWSRVSQSQLPWTYSQTVQHIIETAHTSSGAVSDIVLQRIEWDSTKDIYRAHVETTDKTIKYEIAIDPRSKQVLSVDVKNDI